MRYPCLVILMALILQSCSSTSEKGSTISRQIDQEFEWLDNSDFVPSKQIRYVAKRDHYPQEVADNDSLGSETIDKIPAPKLDDFDGGGDKLIEATSLCYRQKFAQAFKSFDNIYASYKKNPAYWNQLGSCYLKNKELKKALLFYNKAREINGRYAPAVNNIGVIYQLEGKYQKAFFAYKEASTMNGYSLTPMFQSWPDISALWFCKRS